MTQEIAAAASTPSRASAASAGWSMAGASPPVAWRKDADESFPIGGALLLVVLMVAAVWAWWYGRVKGLRLGRGSLLPALLCRQDGVPGGLRVLETAQATGGVRLLVVEWAGGRRVLVATGGTSTPVVLDVMPAGQPLDGGPP